MRTAPSIVLTEDERATLTRWSKGRSTPYRLVQRAKIVLMAAEDMRNQAIALALDTTPNTVGRWRRRFAEKRLAGIEKDAPRSGRRPTKIRELVPVIIKKTTQEKPAAATDWSTHSMATEVGASQSIVHRVWKAAGLKPHLVRTFKLSNDPHFVDKLLDVVGLYLNPPERALVLCADVPPEKGGTTMRTGHPKEPFVLTDKERTKLITLAHRHTASQRMVLRARIILRCMEGGTNRQIASDLGVHENTVGKW
ncbi:helix-turn-helix domain-containing protein, partial [bacterium]|nr:helix-turn-helix domain-containing protein [bacterium]